MPQTRLKPTGLGTEEIAMEQKFVSFEDVLEKLGISSDRLHALRESGQLRAYRDGKSWKFRGDEIATIVKDGLPEPPPPSDIGLVDAADLVAAAPIDRDDDDLELSLADIDDDLEPAPPVDSELELDDTDAVSQGSELDLASLEDTVTTGASDIALDLDVPEPGPSDSILLSEETLGESVSGSPSTIIGRDKLSSGDDDLKLALDDVTNEGSDVKLAPSAGASDVLSSGIQGSGVLDDMEDLSGGTSAFKDLEEIDLSAESSRILSPQDVAEAKAAKETAAKGTPKGTAKSELALDDDLQLKDDDSNMGSTDVPRLELEEPEAGDGSGSAIELASDSDLILADAGGSDLTLDSGDSGINLISPSDSGLALDDIPLEMGGSAILSSLSIEGSDPEVSLISSGSGKASDSMAELQTDDDFQLTPLSETADAEGDSSSQVIALDADIEDFSDGAAVLDEDDFAEDDAGVVLSEDFAEAPAGELSMGYAPVAAAAGAEAPYSLLNVIGLGSSALLLMIAGTMMLDMMRNIWSWDESYSLNSSLMDAILGWF